MCVCHMCVYVYIIINVLKKHTLQIRKPCFSPFTMVISHQRSPNIKIKTVNTILNY